MVSSIMFMVAALFANSVITTPNVISETISKQTSTFSDSRVPQTDRISIKSHHDVPTTSDDDNQNYIALFQGYDSIFPVAQECSTIAEAPQTSPDDVKKALEHFEDYLTKIVAKYGNKCLCHTPIDKDKAELFEKLIRKILNELLKCIDAVFKKWPKDVQKFDGVFQKMGNSLRTSLSLTSNLGLNRENMFSQMNLKLLSYSPFGLASELPKETQKKGEFL